MGYCEICFDKSAYRPIFGKNRVRGVIDCDEMRVTSKEWRSTIIPRPSGLFSSSHYSHPSPKYLDDLLNCRVTSVKHYRSNMTDRSHEIILARVVFGDDVRSIRLEWYDDASGDYNDSVVTICRDHGPGRRRSDCTFIQSFSVPANSSLNVLDYLSLTDSMTDLAKSQPWTSAQWAATFFDCAHEICGAPQIIREPTSRWHGYLGLFNVLNSENQAHDLDPMKTLFSTVWNGTLRVCGLHTEASPLGESKPDSHPDQLNLGGFKKEELRIDPRLQLVLARQAELLRIMITKLGGGCEVDDDKASLASSSTRIGVAGDVTAKGAPNILDENEKNNIDSENNHDFAF